MTLIPKDRDNNGFWAKVAAGLGALLTTIAIAGYSTARSDIRSFEDGLHNVSVRTARLEQQQSETARRLERIEQKLDQLIGRP